MKYLFEGQLLYINRIHFMCNTTQEYFGRRSKSNNDNNKQKNKQNGIKLTERLSREEQWYFRQNHLTFQKPNLTHQTVFVSAVGPVRAASVGMVLILLYAICLPFITHLSICPPLSAALCIWNCRWMNAIRCNMQKKKKKMSTRCPLQF